MSKASRARIAAEKAAGGSPWAKAGTRLVGWPAWVAAVLLTLAAGLAYRNSFSGPFILDDQIAIIDNPTIRHLGTALTPPLAATTGGRPLLNLTFALNYAVGGEEVGGYHAVNLFIHILAGLVLFASLRRTFLTPRLKDRFGPDAALLALAASLIWLLHPLQTESVTYISQRAESLMALFYLLTLYGFLRSASSPAPAGWQIFSVAACLLGVATKEIIITAPVAVILYDRIFISESFRQSWLRRRRYYLGLAATWLPLAWAVAGVGHRHVGFGQGVNGWIYALTSLRSVTLYLERAFWPHPLVLYYGPDLIEHAGEAIPYALAVGAVLAGLIWAGRRQPALGFAGAWFFVILAPTSSVIPVALQPTGEHRMYLPLAAVVSVTVAALYAWLGRRSLVLLAAAAAAYGAATFQRNKDYCSELAIWTDTVVKRPDNAMAHSNLGTILDTVPGCEPDAIAEYRAALRINPGLVETHYNLGLALAKTLGGQTEAIDEFRAALRLNPAFAQAHYSLGNVLLGMPDQLAQAIAEYRAALRTNPRYADAHINLGFALAKDPARLEDAIAEYREALRINPNSAEAHCDLGAALLQLPDHLPEAISEYEAALQISPANPAIHYNLANALAKAPERQPEAIAEYETVVRLDPNFGAAHTNLGIILAGLPGRLPEAIRHFEAALKLSPDSSQARENLRLARQALAAAQNPPR